MIGPIVSLDLTSELSSPVVVAGITGTLLIIASLVQAYLFQKRDELKARNQSIYELQLSAQQVSFQINAYMGFLLENRNRLHPFQSDLSSLNTKDKLVSAVKDLLPMFPIPLPTERGAPALTSTNVPYLIFVIKTIERWISHVNALADSIEKAFAENQIPERRLVSGFLADVSSYCSESFIESFHSGLMEAYTNSLISLSNRRISDKQKQKVVDMLNDSQKGFQSSEEKFFVKKSDLQESWDQILDTIGYI